MKLVAPDSEATSSIAETSSGGGTAAGVPVNGSIVPNSRVVVGDHGRARPL